MKVDLEAPLEGLVECPFHLMSDEKRGAFVIALRDEREKGRTKKAFFLGTYEKKDVVVLEGI